MKNIRLGDQGLEVSAIGVGCMGMSEFYGEVSQVEATATIHAAIDREVTLIDTADMYGPFKNEQLVGQALSGRRDPRVCSKSLRRFLEPPADRLYRYLLSAPRRSERAD